MPNTTTSPNMNLPVPVVSVDPGPDWATNIDACLSAIDSHNHSNGQGVQVNPDGININADLAFNANNATTLRSTRFQPQSAALSNPSDVGCLYENGVDLYYNDGNGNQVRITQGGSVTGSTGTITGLPSGTASASYSVNTFTFDSATNTPANMNVGPVSIGLVTANSKTVTLQPTSGIPSNYTLSFPAAAPTGGQVLISDASGNFTWLSPFIAQGTFTGTFTGMNGNPTNAFHYAVANGIVTVTMDPTVFSGLLKQGTGTVLLTGMPASILPTSSTLATMGGLSVNNGSTYSPCLITISSSGFTIYRDLAGNSIVDGSNCVFLGTAMTYLLRS